MHSSRTHFTLQRLLSEVAEITLHLHDRYNQWWVPFDSTGQQQNTMDSKDWTAAKHNVGINKK